MSLKSQFEAWILVKGIGQAFQKLEAKHVGQQLSKYLDQRFGEAKSEDIQQQLTAWLKSVIKELDQS